MQVSGIQSGYNDVPSQSTKPGQSVGAGEDGVQQFMDYMKETPAQRLFTSFLNSHHITQSQFDAMSPKQQQALTQQFEQQLKQQMAEASDKGTSVALKEPLSLPSF
jgi:hypothetical protein